MVEEVSFGVIPLMKDNAAWQVFLILHKSGNHWGFPKGHANGNETPQESATRELKEETGLTVERFLQTEPLIEQFQFRKKGVWVSKKVYFFPALVSGTPQLQLEEVREGMWVPLHKATEVLSFKEGRTICNQLIELLKASSL